MFYFANPNKTANPFFQRRRDLGVIVTPKQGNVVPDGVTFCIDNGCGPNKKGGIGGGYPGDERFLAFLGTFAHRAADCLFAVAPDVVGDARATLARSLPMLPRMRQLGFMTAFVAQDGLEDMVSEIPWDLFDVLFVGGSTDWKMGPAAARLVALAKAHGKLVHFGRVNSHKRMKYAESIGCDTADGTYLTFGARKNLPNLLAWLDNINLGHAIPPLSVRAAAYGIA